MPALTPVDDLGRGADRTAKVSLRMQQEDPLQDLPQLAPPAPEPEPEPEPAEPAPEPEPATPRLADTGLETLVLAWLGVALLAVGLTTLTVLRKAHRLLDGGRG